MQLQKLQQIGFTEKEAQVYLMLLRIGPSPASILAKRVDLKRVTVYSVLDSLSERGIVTFERMKHGRRYIPHDPECLLYNLEKEFSKVKFKIQLAKDCITELQNVEELRAQRKKRQIFHYGEATIQNILSERFHANSPLLAVFMNYQSNTGSAVVLEKFLQQFGTKHPGVTQLCVPAHMIALAQNQFKSAHCTGADFKTSVNGDLLIQGDRIFFLYGDGNDVHGMQLDDPSYVRFMKEVLLKPHFKKEPSL